MLFLSVFGCDYLKKINKIMGDTKCGNVNLGFSEFEKPVNSLFG
jgi:hypothetical protein